MSGQTMKVALFRFHAIAMDHLNTSTLVYFRLPAASRATIDHLGVRPRVSMMLSRVTPYFSAMLRAWLRPSGHILTIL